MPTAPSGWRVAIGGGSVEFIQRWSCVSLVLDGFKFVRFSKSATVSERQKSSAIFRRLISLSHSAQGLHLFCQPGAAFSQV
jgi:hypothetical protein